MAQQNPMEFIWEHIPKQEGGKTICYLKGDLDYLYYHGFVNSRRFTLQQWKNAFVSFKQPDESYVLTKEQFMLLEPFRYTGPSHELFNPAKLKERAYTDEELKLLFDRGISIASDVNEKFYWSYINAFKKQGHVDKDGNLVIGPTVKAGLYVLLEKFPSPRRRLEKEVLRIRLTRDAKLQANQKNRDASGFMVGETNIEAKQAALEALQASTKKPKKKKGEAEEEAPKKDTLDIKKLRKPPKKIKGI